MKTKTNSNHILGAALLFGTAAMVGRALVRRPKFAFANKTALVTGGSRGLGFLLAKRLLREGARVAICARNARELERASKGLSRGGRQFFGFACDLAERSEVENMVERVGRTLGPVDVLINNAGIIQVGPMSEMKLDDYEEALKNNFWPAVYTTLAVLPSMRQRHAGRIVNISSIGGKVSVPHLLPYCCSKFALAGFSEGVRIELAKEGILVTTVFPGLMRTGSPGHALFKGRHRSEFAWFSISDALPLVSMNAERAARQILAASRRGDAELILSFPARIGALLHSLFPAMTSELLSLANRCLPGPGGIGTQILRGDQSTSVLAPSWLTSLNDKAARRSNQV
jgi:short-subunit dehydrogenase